MKLTWKLLWTQSSEQNATGVIEAALLDNRPVRAYVKLTDTYEYIEELRGKLLARSKESPHAQP